MQHLLPDLARHKRIQIMTPQEEGDWGAARDREARSRASLLSKTAPSGIGAANDGVGEGPVLPRRGEHPGSRLMTADSDTGTAGRLSRPVSRGTNGMVKGYRVPRDYSEVAAFQYPRLNQCPCRSIIRTVCSLQRASPSKCVGAACFITVHRSA